MSYILGALKKADQERRRASEVKIADWDQDDWDDPTPADHTGRWLFGLVLGGLVVVLSIFGFVAVRVLETVPQNSTSHAEQVVSTIAVPANTTGETRQVSEADQALSSEENFETLPNQTEAQEQMQEGDELFESGQALPEFSGHLYFPGNPGLSRVFANSSSYTEGEIIRGYRIEQIGERSLLLSKDGQEIEVNLRN